MNYKEESYVLDTLKEIQDFIRSPTFKQLIKETHENNIMLRQIVKVINTHTARHHQENEDDFMRNILALRWSLETLQNKFPSASIVCVTPIKRGTRTTAEMEAKCTLIKKICNYMAIPVVDGYNISGFSPLSYGIYSSDQIHPNSYSQRVARSIAAQVNTLA